TANEQAFIEANGLIAVTDGTWIGGQSSNPANPGAWTWVTGPEAGQSFSYDNWRPTEPNGGFSAPGYAQILQSGEWNDAPDSLRPGNGIADGYLVEWGGRPQDTGFDEDTVLTIGTAQLLANDTDVDSGAIVTVTSVAALSAAGVPVSLSGTDISYDPTAVFNHLAAGESATDTFTYTVTDEFGATDTATVTLTIEGRNDGPVAMADTNAGAALIEQGFGIAGNDTATGNLLTNDTDVDASDVLTVTAVDSGTGETGSNMVVDPVFEQIVLGKFGSLAIAADGTWTYRLNDADPDTEALGDGDTGIETFTYTMIDSNGGTDTATLTLEIAGSDDNAAPVAVDDTISLDEDTSATLDLLGNDTDANNQPVVTQTLSVASINGTAATVGAVIATSHGSITIGAGGSVDYTPNDDYSGADSFTYVISDGLEESTAATVSLTVEAVVDAPEMVFDTTPTPVGGSSLVNETLLGTQRYATVAALDDGGFVVTWSSNESGSFGIFAQRYDAGGVKVGGETLLSAPPNTSVNMAQSAVTGLQDGGYLVAWQNEFYTRPGGTLTGSKPLLQRFDADGVAQTDVFSPPKIATLELAPDVTELGNGNLVVTWTGNRYSNTTDIFYQVITPDGVVVSGPRVVSVSNPSSSYEIQPSVAALEAGGFVISYSSNTDGGGYGVYSQVFKETGFAITGDLLVNSFTANNQFFPSVIGLEGGGFAVTWVSAGQDGDVAGIYAQVYDNRWQKVGGETHVSTATAGFQTYPTITALDDGGFLVTWSSTGNGEDGYGIYAQRLDAFGQPVGEEYRVNDVTAGVQFSWNGAGGENTATLNDGSVVTVWDNNTGTSSGYDIAVRITEIPAGNVNGIEDQGLAINLEAALTDTDGSESLSVTLSGFPVGATFNLGSADGANWVIAGAETVDLSTLEMTPPQDYNGSFTLTATATATETATGETAETTQTAVLNILAVNDAPVTSDAVGETPEDTALHGFLEASDVDVTDTIAFTLKTGPAHGSVTIDPDGQYHYTPDENFSGDDSFTFTVSDGQITTDVHSVSLTVQPVADAPTLTVTPDLLDELATPTPVGGSSLVNETLLGTQRYATVAALDDGGFVVTWSSNESGSFGIFAQRYDAGGVKVGGETLLSAPPNTSVNMAQSAVTGLQDGGYLVAWQNEFYTRPGGTLTGSKPLLQRFDADGVAQTDVFSPPKIATLELAPDVTELGNGNLVVTWTGNRYSNTTDIFYQVITPDGVVVSGPRVVSVSNPSSSYEIQPSVAALEAGGFVISYSSNTDGGGYGVYSQVFKETGFAITGDLLVNSFTANNQFFPSVIGLEGGGFAVTWVSAGQDGDVAGIYAQVYDNRWQKVGGETHVSTATAGFQTYPTITALDDGGFLVTWSSTGNGEDGYGIYAQRLDAFGQPVGEEYRVNDVTAGVQFSWNGAGGENTATLIDGSVVTVWDNNTGTSSGYDIAVRITEIPAGNVNGIEDQGLAINLEAALTDTDGSESLSVTLSGFPVGATFNLGSADGANWVIAGAETVDLSTLEMTPPQDYNGSFTLTATATATETATGETAETTQTAVLNILAVNDAPVVSSAVTLDPVAEDTGVAASGAAATSTAAAPASSGAASAPPAAAAPSAAAPAPASAAANGPRVITQAELLANASDIDGDDLTAVNLTIVAGAGALTDNLDGTWSFVPAPNDDTDVSFAYEVTDGIAAPIAATATLDLTPVNDAPVINAETTDANGAIQAQNAGPTLIDFDSSESPATSEIYTQGDYVFIPLDTTTVADLDGDGDLENVSLAGAAGVLSRVDGAGFTLEGFTLASMDHGASAESSSEKTAAETQKAAEMETKTAAEAETKTAAEAETKKATETETKTTATETKTTETETKTTATETKTTETETKTTETETKTGNVSYADVQFVLEAETVDNGTITSHFKESSGWSTEIVDALGAATVLTGLTQAQTIELYSDIVSFTSFDATSGKDSEATYALDDIQIAGQPQPDDLTATGVIGFTDIDIGDTHSVAPVIVASDGALGTLTASVTDQTAGGLGGTVTWTYDVPSASIADLVVGQTKVETFEVSVLDSNGASATETVTILVSGGSAGSLAALFGTDGAENLTGTLASEAMFGSGGDDTIVGAGGSDRMWGGDGGDTFVFEDLGASATINDFQDGPDAQDVLDISAFGIVDFAALQLAISPVGSPDTLQNDVLIQLDDNDSILLRNVDIADLDADDFVF
ncbi:VCBS repeat-containing protein, partial [Pelagimonas varians]